MVAAGFVDGGVEDSEDQPMFALLLAPAPITAVDAERAFAPDAQRGHIFIEASHSRRLRVLKAALGTLLSGCLVCCGQPKD